jgi:hypothetical protein
MTHLRHPPTRFCIIPRMTETYASKRERWQRLLDALPDNLRGHISLRNVEAVSALPPQAQQTLADSIQAGLKRLPRAVEILGQSPDIGVSELLQAISAANSATARPVCVLAVTCAARRQLADLIQLCYPDMPRLSAESLAEAESLSEVLQVAAAHEAAFNSPRLRSDFVLVILHACLAQALEGLEKKLAENPAWQQAVSKSGVFHPSPEGSNV